MTDQHPITPPPELVQEWWESTIPNQSTSVKTQLCIQAAQWGANQQLAEDAKWLDQHALDAPHLKITPVGKSLIEAMRPKPPSLKEQALHELNDVYNRDKIDDSTYDTIRKALEALDD